MLPEGWRRVTLADVTREQVIGTPSRGVRDGPAVPLLKMGNLLWGSLDLRSVETIDRHLITPQDCLLQAGDILFNTRNTPELVGKTAFWNAPYEAAFDNNIMRIRMNYQAYPAYVALWMGSDIGRKAIGKFVCASTSVGAVYWRDLCKMALPLPPVPEQRRIAAVLDAWDNAIATAERLVEAQRRLRTGIEDNVLGQGKPTRLTDAADIWFSGVDKKIVHGEQSVRLCNYMDVLRNRRLTDGIAYSAGSATGAEADRFALKQGDVVFTKDSESAEEIAEPAYVAEALNGVVCGCHLGIARPKDGVSGAYLAHAIRSQKLRQQFVRRANGAIRFGLTLDAMAQVELPLPGLNRQVAIAGALDAADDEIARLIALGDMLRHQKRGLMPLLLTGKLRVPESIDALLPPGPAHQAATA